MPAGSQRASFYVVAMAPTVRLTVSQYISTFTLRLMEVFLSSPSSPQPKMPRPPRVSVK